MGARFPVRLHGGDLLGLVLQRVEAVHVAREDLERDQHRAKPDAEAHSGGRCRGPVAPEPAVGREPRHEEGHGQAGGQQHVGEAVGHGGVEDDGPPVRCVDDTVAQLEARRRVHPAVEHQDPEGAHGGAEGHQRGGERVHPTGHAAGAEQHDAEEHRLEEEGSQHLIGKERARHVAHALHEARPVGAELEGHGDAGDDAEREGQGKDLHPEHVEFHPLLLTRGVEAELEEQQNPAERDGDRREQDVEGYVGGKLYAREQQGFHASPLNSKEI